MSRRTFEVILISFLTISPVSIASSSQELLGEGFSLMAGGDAASALTKIEEALELGEEAGDRHGRALGLFLRGILTARDRGFEAVEEDWTESLDIFEELHDHFGTFMVRMGQAAVFQQTSNPERALKSLRATLEWLEAIERSGSTGSFDTLKVLVAGHPQLPPEMRAVIHQMDAVFPMMQPMIFRSFRATTLVTLAKALEEREEHEEALRSLEEALELSENLGGLDVQVLQEMARVKRSLGREEEAAADEAKARERPTAQPGARFDPQLQQGLLSMMLEGVAPADQSDGSLEAMEDRLARARLDGDVRSEALLLGLLGREYQEKNRREEATFYYERSLETAWHARTRSDEMRDEVPGADAPGADLFAVIEAAAEADEILAAASHASHREVYDALLLLSVLDGQADVAFDYAERARAEASQPDGAPPLIASIGLEELRVEALDGETTLLVYYVAGPKALAWVVDRDRAEHAVLDLPPEVLLRRAGSIEEVGSPDFDVEGAEELYRELIAPLAPWIRHDHLIVVAQGALRDLPFESFRDPETGRFLAEERTVTRVHGLGALRSPSASVP